MNDRSINFSEYSKTVTTGQLMTAWSAFQKAVEDFLNEKNFSEGSAFSTDDIIFIVYTGGFDDRGIEHKIYSICSSAYPSNNGQSVAVIQRMFKRLDEDRRLVELLNMNKPFYAMFRSRLRIKKEWIEYSEKEKRVKDL